MTTDLDARLLEHIQKRDDTALVELIAKYRLLMMSIVRREVPLYAVEDVYLEARAAIVGRFRRNPNGITLNTLETSAEYLNFLAKTYPKFAPFLDIHDFDKRVMPPKDRYLKFCQEYLNIPSAEEITDDEQYVIHHIATSSWASEASQRGKDRYPLLQPGKPFRLGHVLAFKPIGRKILEQREGKRAAFAFVLLTAQEHLDERVLSYPGVEITATLCLISFDGILFLHLAIFHIFLI